MYGSAAGGRGFLRAYECVDVRRDLESCGGCVYDDSPFGERSADGGRDCSAIPFVDAVTCSAGQCIVCECLRLLVPGAELMGLWICSQVQGGVRAGGGCLELRCTILVPAREHETVVSQAWYVSEPR